MLPIHFFMDRYFKESVTEKWLRWPLMQISESKDGISQCDGKIYTASITSAGSIDVTY